MNKVHWLGLEALSAVMSSGSFRGAAQQLGISPSALSHRIRALEEALALRVLHRTTRSHAITPAGEALLDQFTPARDGIWQTVQSLQDQAAQVQGVLRINAAPLACRHVLPAVLARLVAQHPGVSVQLVSEGALVDIVNEGFDAGIRFPSTVPLDMVAHRLGPDQRFVIVASPDYLAAAGTPRHPTDLHQHRCCGIRFSSGRRFAWEFFKDGVSAPIEVPETILVTEPLQGLALAREGIGLAFCAEADAALDIMAGRLSTVLDDWRPAEPGFRLYYPSRRQLRAPLRALVDLLPSVFG